MADSKGLFPTKTRLALLAAIKAREVTGYPTYDSGHVDYFWGLHRDGQGQRADPCGLGARIRAGAGGRTPDFKVTLTDLGEKVLAAGRELDGSTHDGYPEVDRG
jgi:hypothetical protein